MKVNIEHIYTCKKKKKRTHIYTNGNLVIVIYRIDTLIRLQNFYNI